MKKKNKKPLTKNELQKVAAAARNDSPSLDKRYIDESGGRRVIKR